MSFSAAIPGGPLTHEWRSTKLQQRLVSMGLVVGLHMAVIGGFVFASLKAPPDPPQPILQVSLIHAATPAAVRPSPAQPSEPTPAPPVTASRPPEPTLLSTRASTASAMTAPPVERRLADPTPPAAPPAPAPAPAASAGAPAATSGPSTPPNFRAAYLNNPGPTYPPSSRRKREEGVVRLRVQVSAEGAPNQVQLERSSGSADLDNAALDIVRKRWRFVPAQQAGKPVSAWVIVPLEFSLTR